MRTVEDFITAGAAAIHIEEQVAPKRCGHVAGKQIVAIEEMVGKLRAADRVRRELDPDFVLIARCDARGLPPVVYAARMAAQLNGADSNANCY